MEEDSTRIATFAGPALAARVHCLRLLDGPDAGRRFMIGPEGATIGRTPPADIVFPDPEVSRAHCRLAARGDDLVVTDLGSTNGAFVDGVRVQAPTSLPVGGVLRVGRQSLEHERRTENEIAAAEELDRDLAKAAAYIQALLPPPLAEGPIRADWAYQPSAKLGGDAFGYGALPDGRFAFYLMDVSGHGAGAAMHSVAVMNLLRQRALPNTDLADPGQVLATLNDMFQMEEHAGLFFTMWYGVFDPASRRLDFASAGQHPAYLKPTGGGELTPLRARGGLIGAIPGKRYVTESAVAPPGASLYLFSDGVFEIVTVDDLQWTLTDFLPLILGTTAGGAGECQRIFQAVTGVARPGGLDDDFSLVALTFV